MEPQAECRVMLRHTILMETQMTLSPKLAAFALLFMTSLSPASLAGENGRVNGTEAGAATRTVYSGSCANMTATNFKTDNSTGASTVSNSFVDVPNSSVSFTQGGSGNGCVIVSFSGESYAPSGRLLLLQARLDSSTTASPGTVNGST